MAANNLPAPSLTLSKREARRLMLAHQQLWPPRQLEGPAGVLDFIRRVGSIQYDPINRIGRNPDLVLQSRVTEYRPALLESLLYAERKLLDGWDKMASIYAVEDRPYFARWRELERSYHDRDDHPPMEYAPQVRQAIQERGPLCSLDIKHKETVDWFWGVPVSLPRAALEILYGSGELVVHHRMGSRRYFDLAERVLPADLLATPDPNPDPVSYQEWHVLRRLGSMGLARPQAGEQWLGIAGVKSPQRLRTLTQLVEQEAVVALAIDELPGQAFFMRAAELPLLERLRQEDAAPARAALIAPLDNLLWDRELVRSVFDFDYVWEVYKPAAQRRYGYYVLPVLFGDRLVARVDLALARKEAALTLIDWWWEPEVRVDERLEAALVDCLAGFMRTVDARELRVGSAAAGRPDLAWVEKVG